MSVMNALKDAVCQGNIESAAAETRQRLEAGDTVQEILNDGLIAAMDEVGEQFSKGNLFVPQMLRSAKAMQEAMKLIKPFFKEQDITTKGTIVIGTVRKDLHDIGKNLVAMMIEGAGFTIIDMGVDVSPDRFVAAVKEQDADILAMSALLSTTMPGMQETIKALDAANIRNQVKVMIGGAPVTSKFAGDIHADVYAPDAGAAVIEAKKLLGIA